MPKEYEQVSMEDRESLSSIDTLGERDPEQGGADTNPLAIDRAESRAMTFDEENNMLRSKSSVALPSCTHVPRAHARRRPAACRCRPRSAAFFPRSVRPLSKHAQLRG